MTIQKPSGVFSMSQCFALLTLSLLSSVYPLHASENIIVVIGGGSVVDPLNPVGDNGPALSAHLKSPCGIIFDTDDNAYVVDQENHRIRKVTKTTGIITTIAGTGEIGFSGDTARPATSAKLAAPSCIAFDLAGNLLITDQYNHRIRKVTLATGEMTTIAGSGAAYSSLGRHTGDGGPATSAELNQPEYLVVAPNGDIYFSDLQNHRIGKIAGGIVTTIAGDAVERTTPGNAVPGFSGDGGVATNAKFNLPTCLRLDAAGNLYVADCGNGRIRKFSISGGTVGNISTIAGGGTPSANAGDGNIATLAHLALPTSMIHDATGNLFIADQGHHRIRRVDQATNIITTVAGTGVGGFAGNGGPAVDAQMNYPTGVAFDHTGHLFTTERGLNMIRELVSQVSPAITWVPQSATYGEALGAGQLNAVTSVPGTFAYSPISGVVLSAGTFSLQATFTPTDTFTYSGATATASVTITPAPLVVVAEDQYKIFGAANPALTYHVAGLVNGDSAAVITGSPVLSTTATNSSAVGTYPITADISGMSATNYTVASAAASLIVSSPTTPTPAPSSNKGGGHCGLGSGVAALIASVALLILARSTRLVGFSTQ